MKSILALIALFPVYAFADISVKFSNNGANDICLHSYNGRDTTLSIPYKYKRVKAGETKSIKCKGQGRGRCKITVTRRLDGGSMSGRCQAVYSCGNNTCPDDITDPSGTKIKKNDICTYSSQISDVTDQVAGESISCQNSDSTVEYTDDLNP